MTRHLATPALSLLPLLWAADARAAEPSGPETSVKTESREDHKRKKIPHNGFTLELRGGALGCTGSICRSAQNAGPGGQVAGFIGGNVRGWVDLGLQGSWGVVRPDIDEGSTVLDLYGIDASAVEEELSMMGMAPDLSGLTVTDADVTAMGVGPAFRIHFIPRGRMLAYAGAGIGYQLYRSTYTTPMGTAKLSFHGLQVPIVAGLGVHVIRNLAVTAQFDYTWTYFPVAHLDTPVEQVVLPISLLDSVGSLDLQSNLPKFWGVTFGVRARF